MGLTTTNAAVRLFLAPACAACDADLERPLDGPVCGACWRAIQKLTPPCCVRCGDVLPSWRPADPRCPRCRRHEPLFSLARSAGLYDGSLRRIVHAYKYERRRVLAQPLAALMLQAGADVLAGADALVPVPLHPWRALRRGFNQADDLARHLGLPVWRVLRRRRHGPPQAGLPASRRHANVRDAYALARFTAAVGPRRLLPNRVVVLVDDVMTTGATLEACGRVLLDAGVRNVRALTIARAAAGPRAVPPP
jgi:ComF family protein